MVLNPSISHHTGWLQIRPSNLDPPASASQELVPLSPALQYHISVCLRSVGPAPLSGGELGVFLLELPKLGTDQPLGGS